ncbi:ABC transporter ATP-binding protein [Chlorobium sp. N1]|uniref:ABC transporter ATP-binding protein n=1 Tax=Chlorobium sp. N1 TaxID=2491138 RepID=UPI0010390728|nr:ABC transporter ATP-binding protein [Chlorobium sp. N1]TCD47457.1 ABC transporter ATP-binding protein [Chlorobium sp. N1]
MAHDALSFRSVSAGYSHRLVLDRVSFSVREGEFVSLIGPNGSGKSTLLKTAASLIKPISGSVELFGRSVSQLKPRERASLLGVVPQKLDAPMAFSVSEIVMNGRVGSMGLLGRISTQDHDLVERAMIYTDVLPLADRYFGELSGGEQQRVALAMVLAQEPRVIMLDESISHLDINHRNEVLQILLNLNRERQLTIVLVSHDLSLSAAVSDRLLLMHEGRLAADGAPHEVLRPELLGPVYDCELQVRPDPYTGALQVSGNLEGRKLAGSSGLRTHVVAGGGSGIELYRRLLLEGFGVTTGVLNELDSDAEAARALSITSVLEQPFSPVGPIAAECARMMALEADAVIISHVPFGSGNLVNLELADDALRRGRRVFIAAGLAERDYTDGRAASRLLESMTARGAQSWQTMHELIMKLQQQPS